MSSDKKPGCSFLIWYFWKYVLSIFLLKSDKFLKHCIPEAFRKVPEDYPEAKQEGKIRMQNTAFRKLSGRFRKTVRKQNQKEMFNFLIFVPHQAPQKNQIGAVNYPEGKRKLNGSYNCPKVRFESQGSFGDFERAFADTCFSAIPKQKKS